ncbi:MAG: thioesterase family protein [Candidatus Binatia bacterium]|nr:thioesterase family protein [Candidatus Binatia bacterium]
MDPAFEAEDLTTLLTLENDGADQFFASAAHYPWGRVYGGLVVAQALAAAARTVEERYRVHSLHAYFIRGGNSDEKIRYEVDRIRDGRSFCTRRAVARQSSGAILNLSASFQVAEDEAADAQNVPFPGGVPGPDDLPVAPDSWSRVLENKPVPMKEWFGQARNWIRVRERLGDDPTGHAAGLAYASDDVLIDAAARCHPKCPAPDDEGNHHHDLFMAASLDHAIWFHRPFRADDWLLHDVRARGMRGGRGLSIADLFDQGGHHVATVTQECLLREIRPR